MLAWSEETDNGRQKKTRNHGYDVIVSELFTDYSDHPLICPRLNPKLKSTGAGRYQLLSRWWDAYRKQQLKDFSPKSQDAVALQQIKGRGALPMIDRGDIRQAIDRCSNIWASAGRWLWSVQATRRQPDCKIQRSGRNGQRLMYEQSPRLSPLWLSASSSACHGLLIITVITPLPQSPARQKCRKELKLANAAITDMQMRQRDVAALDAKIHEGVSWC